MSEDQKIINRPARFSGGSTVYNVRGQSLIGLLHVVLLYFF